MTRDGAPSSKLEMEHRTYAAAMRRSKVHRFQVSVPVEDGSGWTFPTKAAALKHCAARLANGGDHGLRLLDRRTGMYLDPTTGNVLPADQQRTGGAA